DLSHPSLKLDPLKVEEIYKKPDVFMFHDFVTDKESAQVIEFAKPKLRRDEVESNKTFLVRTSDGFFCNQTFDVRKRIYKRIEAATGLTTDENPQESEPMQIINYLPMTYYTPHFDYLPEEEASETDPRKHKFNNRIATVMIYLNNVESGGNTVFPLLNVAIEAKKNAAVFWHNLWLNGTGIVGTLHGGCPVVFGEKWSDEYAFECLFVLFIVLNKWIHAYGQMFHRKCSTNRFE
ncbi:vacuolar protein sorting-associated protein 33A-like protein, partial [Dinothrombium tinctorium]